MPRSLNELIKHADFYAKQFEDYPTGSEDAIDSATEYVSSVAPIRSSGVMNSKAKIGVLPGKLRKSMEHVVLATTLAVAIITISSLLALAFMFGILR